MCSAVPGSTSSQDDSQPTNSELMSNTQTESVVYTNNLTEEEDLSSVPESPSTKRSFFKKNVEDGMDR